MLNGTAARKLRESYKVPYETGALGDGVTEEYAALQAAFSSGAKVVDGLNRTYKANTPITFQANQIVRNMTIDLSGVAGAGPLASVAGSQGASVALTADAVIRTRTVPVATAGFAVDDYVYIGSNDVWDTDGNHTGELNQVKSIDNAGQLTLKVPMDDTYALASGASIAKVTFADGVELQNVRIIGGGVGKSQLGLQLTLTNGAKLKGVTIKDCDNAALTLTRCFGARVRNSKFLKATLAGFAYGVVIERACRDIDVESNRMEHMRHGLTIGGSEGVSRDIRVRGNEIWYCGDAGIDSHPASQRVLFADNNIDCAGFADWASNTDGIVFQGADGIITGNTVKQPRGTGIWGQSAVLRVVPSITIAQNVVHAAGVSNNPSIYVSGDTAASGWKGVGIANNRCLGSLDASNPAIMVYANTAPVSDVTITGNTIEDAAGGGITVRNVTRSTITANVVSILSTSTQDAILVLTSTRATVTGNTINQGAAGRYGINVQDVIGGSVVGNVIELAASATAAAIILNASSSGSGQHITVDANVAIPNAPVTTCTGLQISTNVLNVRVGCNDFEQCATPISWGGGTGHKGGALYGSATYDPPSLAAGASQQTTVTVTGAIVSDIARVTFSLANAGIVWRAEVTANNTVTVTMTNVSGAAIDLASGTLRASVERH